MIVKFLPYVAGIVAFIVARAMGAQSSAIIIAGGLVGIGCGLLPFFTLKRKSPAFAQTSLWVCGGSGILGGVLLAVPAAVTMIIIGCLKGNPSA